MKFANLVVVAALATSSTAFAQDAGDTDAGTEVDASTEIVDSFDDNSDREFTDSFNDNSERVFEDSFDDNSRNFSTGVGINNNSTFGDLSLIHI